MPDTPYIEKNKQNYQKDLFRATRQVMQMPVIELVKTGQLQSANSLTLLAEQDFIDRSKEWFSDFAKDHNLEMPVRVAHCPNFPKDKLSQDKPTLISAEVKLMNPHQTEMDKLDKSLKIGDYSKDGSGRYH